jgi:ferritin
MLDAALVKALNEQIHKELEAWYTYLAMAAWCEAQYFNGYASFMDAQSREEQAHAHRLIRYVLDRGADIVLKSISPPPREFGSLLELFTKSREQERANTRAIYELYELAKEKNDYATVAALQWFLDEQVEEEKVMDEALGLLRFAGDDRSAILALNDRYGKVRPKADE